jgi:hypothetical protein
VKQGSRERDRGKEGRKERRADIIDGGGRPREGGRDLPGLLGTSSPLLYSPLTAVSFLSSITMRYTGFDRIRAGLVVLGPAAPPCRPIAECSVLALAGGYIIAGADKLRCMIINK